MDIRQVRLLTEALIAAAAGFLLGFVLHLITAYVRDHGPTWGVYSLRGNGSIVLVLLALLALLVGEILYVRRRAWLAMALLPLAMALGLFGVLGGI